MIIRTLQLTNFRNLDGEFTFDNGVNLIIGQNGKGKTNLLESMYYLAIGKSFRTQTEISVINHASKKSRSSRADTAFARIAAVLEDGMGNQNLLDVVVESKRDAYSRIRKTLMVNKKKTTTTKFGGNMNAIIFSPVTVDLVISSPSVRRRDLDEYLQMYDSSYKELITTYRKIIRNRNKLLERILERKASKDELNYWNEQLIDIGSKIIHIRNNFIIKVNNNVQNIAHHLFNSDIGTFDLAYESKFLSEPTLAAIKQQFKEKIDHNIQKEIYATRSLYGPHREDFHFLLDTYNVREFGSRGQQRICAFLYKIIQWKLLEKKVGTKPLLLLDDLLSELDPDVQYNVQKFLQKLHGQIVITSTSENELSNQFDTGVKKIRL